MTSCCCDVQTLTSQQEAFLDSHSYPWCPDMWQMAQLLAAGKAEPDVQDNTAGLDLTGVALSSLLPDQTAFQVLTKPFRARGLGLRLKSESADLISGDSAFVVSYFLL